MFQLTIRQAHTRYALRARSKTQRGQSVVFALLALLILSFAGALFIGIVTRNLRNSQLSSNSGTAQGFAQAGIQFADDQLTNSMLGADWRPPRQNLGSATNDPDYYNIMNLGYTRYNFGSGRFLLRVTYNPVNASVSPAPTTPPTAPVPALIGDTISSANRFIKIECIGETGVVDSTDPTTYATSSHASTDAMVAYKQIGLTDYTRFITDPNKTGSIASLGVPTVTQSTSKSTAPGISGSGIAANGAYTPGVWDFPSAAMASFNAYPIQENIGAPDAYIYSGGNVTVNELAGTGKVAGAFGGGGSLRSNTSVRFYGLNNIYLDRPNVAYPDGVGFPVMYNEGVEVAGNVYEDGYTNTNGAGFVTTGGVSPAPTSFVALHTIVKTSGSPAESAANPVSPTSITPSGSTLTTFDTASGGFRDGGAGTNAEDANGYPRMVNRLEPPVMDAIDPFSSLPRYRALTEQSAVVGTMDAQTVNGATAAQGYGRYTYIDNFSDLQSESSEPLPTQWIDEGGSSPGWGNNDIYDPAGVNIAFGPQTESDGVTYGGYGYRITRNDKSAGSQVYFHDVDGNATDSSGTGKNQTTLTVLYSDLGADSTSLGSEANDIIIYAEGNVRLRGSVSADPADPIATAIDKAPRHVTIVTNGTAYIDGSLLKGHPDSSITVLAHDYVCVNTTQFFVGKTVSPFPTATLSQPTGSGTGGAVPHFVSVAISTGTNNSTVLQEFSMGLPHGLTPTSVYNGATVYGGDAQYLYLSAQAGSAVSGTSPDCEPTVNFANPLGTSIAALAVGTIQLGNGTIPEPTMVHNTFALPGLATATPTPTLLFEMQVPATNSAGQANLPMNLERSAVLPGDVRIEAVLFAQTKSFFVIPGPWFNSNSLDSILTYVNNAGVSPGGGTIYHGTGATPFMDRYPFYGQPVDLKITIAGSIVEANTADIGAQAKWMEHWGWIPQFHGSLSTELNGHDNGSGGPATGFTIIYDPSEGTPYDFGAGGYYRTDSNGNPLPFAPALPVCPGLVYEGEASTYSANALQQLIQ